MSFDFSSSIIAWWIFLIFYKLMMIVLWENNFFIIGAILIIQCSILIIVVIVISLIVKIELVCSLWLIIMILSSWCILILCSSIVCLTWSSLAVHLGVWVIGCIRCLLCLSFNLNGIYINTRDNNCTFMLLLSWLALIFLWLLVECGLSCISECRGILVAVVSSIHLI